MAEKVSTLIIETDLDCAKCYRKIQKLLRKLRDKEKIRTIDFDTKKNTVIVSGPFNPVRLSGKLRCENCEAIKGITIVEEKKPELKKMEPKKPEPKGEKKPAEEKKKPAVDCCKCCKNPDDKPNPIAAPARAPSTTVNLHFTQICNMCYPWPCSDPSHWGGVHQYPQAWHYPYPPWPAPTTPKRQPCGGPPYCGCGSCGGGYNEPPAMPTPPMCCGGPSSCRGCNVCLIVQEEYPPPPCTVM